MSKTPAGFTNVSTTYQLAYETYDGNVQVRKIGERLWEVLPRGGASVYEKSKPAALERAFQLAASHPTRRATSKAYGTEKARAHATRKSSDPTTSSVKLKDRYSGGHVWLTARDGTVVGVMGSDPKRYLGMTIDRAKHVARYGGTGTKRSRHG